jgi:hypothetical protein
MRTTISIDDEAFKIAREYAERREVGIGKAISELVRRGASQPRARRKIGDLQVFDLPKDSPRVTAKRIKQLEQEL